MNERITEVRRGRPRRFLARLDTLECRQLLSGLAADVESRASSRDFFGPKSIVYTTPSGAVARITLKGPGNLSGSSVDADGALRLVYDDTSPNSLIIGKVRGGSRSATVRSVDDADVASTDFTGVNGNLLNTVRLNHFDLVSGGSVNLTGGVGKLYLRSIAANAQVHLRDIPNATPVSTSIQLNSLFSPTAGLGGGPDFNGVTAPLIGTNNNNTPFTVPPSFTSNGVTRSYSTTDTGAVFLRGVSGTFNPGDNIVGELAQGQPPPPPGIPGVLLQVGQILGGDLATAPALIDVQGNLQAIKAGGVNGLVLQDAGDLGVIQIDEASNSIISGFPVGHVKIRRRANVVIYSSTRVVGTRGDVIVDAIPVPTGPLSLPLV
ncbi:MAG: hypothetical protein SFX72_02535 [Isosphaeraceae bacterium]|nr:hypothetical protein [Isosphaeraceae bacterium]